MTSIPARRRARPIPLCPAIVGSLLLLPLSGLAQTSDKNLPEVSVTAAPARADELPPPAPGGQVGSGARLGVLGNLDVMDTPFNVTSYTSDFLLNRQAQTLADVLSSDPSVRFTTSSGHPYENFRIRGFDVNQNDVAINGLYGMTPMGHVPLEFFERVEVLKGPNALFSGMAPSGAIGGTVNLVPKRAGDEPLTWVSLGLLTYGEAGVAVDLGRRFGERNQWGLRVNAGYSDGEGAIEGRKNRRELLSVALDLREGPLRASLDAYAINEAYHGGLPAMYWFAGTTIPRAPNGRSNQFAAARGELDSKAFIAHAEYDILPRLTAFGSLGVMRHDYSGFFNGSHVRSLNAAGTSTTTLTVNQAGYSQNTTTEAGLRGSFQTGPIAHEMVLQASNLDQESGSANTTSAPFTTNIYNPVYQALPAQPVNTPKNSANTLTSFALVDTMSMLDDKLKLILGLRRQSVKTFNYAATGAVTGEYDKSAVTPAVALVAKPWGPDLSLYANYVQGLSKGDSVTTPTYAFNHTFAPYKTKQFEAGIKWRMGTFTNTAAVFQITKPGLIMLAGNVPSDGGEKRVRGVELNTFGEVARGVRLLGGVVYTDGVQTKTANDAFNGNTAVAAPRWQANLGAEWDTPWLPGVTLSSQVMASTSQYVNAANTQQIPGWAVFDLGARYVTKLAGRNLALRLNVNNVFDRAYYSGSFSDTTPIATLGLARMIRLSGSMDF